MNHASEIIGLANTLKIDYSLSDTDALKIAAEINKVNKLLINTEPFPIALEGIAIQLEVLSR